MHENDHGIQVANDMITVINETIIQRILTSPNIKDILIESDTEYIAQLAGLKTKRERSDNNMKNAFTITLPSLFGDVD